MRTPALRDRVLQVELTILADEGVAGLTTRRVALHTRTSIPAVYELFGDKSGVREMFAGGWRSERRSTGWRRRNVPRGGGTGRVSGAHSTDSLPPMPLYWFEGKAPTIDPDAFVAPTATIVGDVTIEAGASVWYGAVIRADYSPVIVRRGANVQDNSLLHGPA